MEIYKEVFVSEKKVIDVVCNMCGEKIKKENNDIFYDYLHIEKTWGYFSNMDCENHSFDLCQNCYMKLTQNFKVPLYKK